MKRAVITLIIIALSLFSCSSLKKPGKSMAEPVVIRYMNLKAVYSSIRDRSSEAAELDSQRKKLLEMKTVSEEKLHLNPGDRSDSLKKLNKIRSDLESLAVRERRFKEKTLKRINRAVKIVARDYNIDFVLNFGDEAIYSKKKYDITEDVIREIMRLEKRGAPVSR